MHQFLINYYLFLINVVKWYKQWNHKLVSILECSEGLYGENCSFNCSCSTYSVCDSVSGNCSCRPGFTGETCSKSEYMYNIFYKNGRLI